MHIPVEGLSKQEIADLKALSNKSHVSGLVSISGKNIFLDPFDIPIPDDCTLPPSYPLCCPYHTALLTSFENWFAEFPNCCPVHKQLAEKRLFKKSNYEDVPRKIMLLVAYMQCHINSKINSENWYKGIVDYFEYTVSSFGQPTIGLDRYFHTLKYEIEKSKNKNIKQKYK